jgi:ATP-binding cassette subfamily B protein
VNVLKQLKEFYWAERKWLFLSFFCLTCATALGLIYPFLLGYLVDDVIGEGAFEQVPRLALLVVGVMVVKAVFQYFQGLTGGLVGNKLAYNLRNALYRKLQYLSWPYYDRAKTGDLMSRLTGDLEGIRQFIGFGLNQILNTILMVTLGIGAMAFINWQLMLLSMGTMPFLAYCAIRFENRIHPAFRAIRRSFSRLTTAVQENITGVRTVKSFARENHELDKFSAVSAEYRDNHIHTARIWARFFPVMELLAQSSVFILIFIGGLFVIGGRLDLGELITFSSLIWYIIGPMWGLGFLINQYTQSKTSGERILEILNKQIDVKDHEQAVSLQPERVKGEIVFENVTFAYPDHQPALHNINLHAPPGSTIGILGGTGSGKTALIQLLLRAYNVKHGKIYLDGQDIERIKMEDLRRQIGLIFQETFLFSATIKSNIAYGRRDASMEEIVRAAKLAQAHDFIMELPLGYDTVVGERGLGLSGGQKQRIAIARALLKDPKILILDDSTSAVDMETEHEIQQGLKEVMRGRTTFIIAHRISSLKHADEIIVLDQGRIVQRGTHEELIRQDGPYLKTYNIQYSDRPKELSASAALEVGERRLAN